MTIQYHLDNEHAIVELTVHGKITKTDFNDIADEFKTFIDEHQTIKILEYVESFPRFPLSLLWRGLKFDIKHLKNISHCAVVTDSHVIKAIAKMTNLFTRCRVRVFRLQNVNEASEWLKQPQ